ncbi:MBL fold metallo-hydrolase [Lederbergia wuyishanensis]|uniref:Glyoxylase-like metal-dependent hydrolase (Beta-lactamase superfamily II) n=1 Tax=Lederbergia wuyishanensis TaxID=1347903 RepID=A0ABU0D2L9_9BACI|nr:MBL fold metallo-hydrolase [Lederbergia wuyishanensis]MCJ8007210.1 MBL fold metallo-hydrolase [Lederbergia wuyishanensis]MDQ0342644.1 glyoxylase-like metal-dependent hydrolase (beta-lactamase superfamily II) [Lederbergia wuyishanensis]
MKTYLEEIAKGVYAFLVWDESWGSFNNCYLLLEDNDILLIDSGKEEHSSLLFSALKSKGILNSDITHFIATHGHKDHIGGIQYLGDVEGFIHNKDLELIPKNLRHKLKMNLPDHGLTAGNLECALLGHHTKGSVLLYHRESKALFCGDHICFFAEPLNDNKVVYTGTLEREKIKQFVSDWSQNEEMKRQHNFNLFMEGLKAINKFDVDYLCTGHGVILKGNINRFISDLLEYE